MSDAKDTEVPNARSGTLWSDENLSMAMAKAVRNVFYDDPIFKPADSEKPEAPVKRP
jgi:hypothetical protein